MIISFLKSILIMNWKQPPHNTKIRQNAFAYGFRISFKQKYSLQFFTDQ